MENNLISVSDLSPEELWDVIEKTKSVKSHPQEFHDRLEHKTIVLIFEKPSTRTKVSFEAAMVGLGGYPITLHGKESQLSRGETPEDSAKVLGRYSDCVVARVYDHKSLIQMSKATPVPVINALSDLEHPCQAIADFYTIYEYKGLEKIKLAYIGDGNNVCNSLIIASAMLGIEMNVSTPRGYEPDEKILEKAREYGEKIEIYNQPEKAVSDADFVYTDVWVGMGDEAEKNQRMHDFREYQINQELLSHAKKDCKVLHCLPAHRGLEITDEVLDSDKAIIWDQAENRLHTQKTLLMKFLG